MSQGDIDELAFHDGTLVLTETHLFILSRSGVAEHRLALKHMTEISIQRAQSFRHRFVGLITAVLLIAFSLVSFGACMIDDRLWGIRPRMWERLAMSGFFTLSIGMVILVGVLRSRLIDWLEFRYAKVRRRVGLPGATPEAIHRFAASIQRLLPESE